MPAKRPLPSLRQVVGFLGLVLIVILVAAIAIWRGDILRAGLDPEVPFQTYERPSAPDYANADAWLLRDSAPLSQASGAAVFFIHPTTYDGRRQWLGPIGEPSADAYFNRVVAPNHVAPFARAGSVSAPRYRQAALYSRLGIGDDAREARLFAYPDVEHAFDAWLARHPTGPIVLVGVEQGGDLLARLLQMRIKTDPALTLRLVAAYVIDSLQPADDFGPQAAIPACAQRAQSGCVVAWTAVREGDEDTVRRLLRRALVFDGQNMLVNLGDRPGLCVNPVSGEANEAVVPARRHLGGANATGLEWGARPGILSRQVQTQCRGGLLRYSNPPSEAFRQRGSWTDQRKAPAYNLFYADLEQDVAARLAAWRAANA
jgi:hypothetical protein